MKCKTDAMIIAGRVGLSCASVLLLAAGLSGCNGTVSVSYDPSTSKVTVTGSVGGKSKAYEVNVPAGGTIEIDDEDCVKIRIQAECGATVKIKCGDPILAQIPTSWAYLGGDYQAHDSGAVGAMEVVEASDFNGPAFASVVTELGFRPVLVRADEFFPDGDNLSFAMDFNAPPSAGIGVLVKAIEVAEIEYSCGPGNEIHDIGWFVDEPAPIFGDINDPEHVQIVSEIQSAPALGLLGLILLPGTLGAVALRRKSYREGEKTSGVIA